MERELLKSMVHAVEAGHRPGDRQGCIRGIRDIILRLEDWLEGEPSQCEFLLNGLAGIGKSVIIQTFAEITFAEGTLGASFFCSRDFEGRNNDRMIFPTLAFQLAYRYPPFREQLLRILRANPGIIQGPLCSQMEELIVSPFKATRIRTLIIIDALDECKNTQSTILIPSVISTYADKIPEVKFLITLHRPPE